MTLSSAIKEIQEIVLSHHQSMLLIREPNDSELDIDLLITNRYCSKLQRDLVKRTSIPVFFDNRKRGFGYYFDDGKIGALDLVDLPILSNRSLIWLAKDCRPSQFCNSIMKLSLQNQVIFYIYKSIKKWKIKDHRYSFLIEKCRDLDFDLLIEKTTELCAIQKESSRITDSCNLMISELKKGRLTYDRYSSIIKLNRAGQSFITLFAKRFNLDTYWSVFSFGSNHQRFPIVAVIGVDGSGKSSIVNGLISQNNALQCSQFRFETKDHLPIFKYLFKTIPKLLRLASRFSPRKLIPYIYRYEQDIMVKMTLQETRSKLRLYFRHSNQGKLVVVDRWWFDYFVASKRSDLLKNHPNLLNEYFNLIKPDTIVFMNAEDEVLSSRRPDDNLQELKLKRSRLSEMLKSNQDLNVVKVNGTANIHDNLKYISSSIYSCWVKI